MTARPIGELAAGLAGTPKKRVRRTNQPVRRNSYHAGEREHQLWRPIADGRTRAARRWIGAVMKSARRFERESMEASRRNGALGHVGLEVLEALFEFVDYRTGRCEPAVATIAGRIKRSRKAVHAALARLRAAGFLDWIRRTEPTDNAGGFGPQVRQISNAYGFRLPERVAAMVRQLLGNAPPPEDALWRCEEHKAAAETMLDGVTAREALAASVTASPAMEASLDRLARAVDNANYPKPQNPGAEG